MIQKIKKNGTLLFLFLLAVRLWSLTGDAAYENWLRSSGGDVNAEKYIQAKAALRKKQREGMQKILLLRLELLQKLMEWDVKSEELGALLSSPTLLQEKKLDELTELQLPGSVIPENRDKFLALSSGALKDLILDLIRIDSRIDYKALKEEVIPKAVLKRYRFDFIPRPPGEEVENRGGTFMLARERAEARIQYQAMREQQGTAPGSGSRWTGQTGSNFIFSLIVGIIAFFKNIFMFIAEYKEYFILFAVGIGAIVGLSVLAAFVRRRY